MNCGKCSKCCESMMFEIKDCDHEYWVRLHGVEVREFQGKTWAYLPIPCQKLKEGHCSVYQERPEMCKRYYCDKFNKETV